MEDDSSEERLGIKRIVKTSDGSFPVVKVNRPFLVTPSSSAIWQKSNKVRQDQGRSKFSDRGVVKVYNSWTLWSCKWSDSLDKADVLIDKLNDNEQGAAMKSLAIRFKKALQSETRFIADITTTVVRALPTGNCVR